MVLRINMQKHIIEYQLCALFAYLSAITITTSMKLTLPIYIVLVMLPFIRKIKRLDSCTLLILIVSFVYLAFGFIFQDLYETATSFLSKVFQFVVFMMIVSNRNIVTHHQANINIKKIMPICFGAESVLGLYLVTHGSLVDASGLTRLTAGRQPVGGNLTIALLPLMIWAYFNDPSSKRSVIIWGSCSAVWVFLSGTRGYMLLFAFSMGLVYWDYLFTLSKKSRNKMLIIFFVIILALGGAIIIVFNNSSILQQVEQLLRLDAGVGGRDNENAIAIGFFKNTTIFYKLFGIGFGGTAADAPGYVQSVAQNTYSLWAYTHYAGRVGTSFHNLYSNYILLQGLVGCIEVVVFFFWGFVRIRSLRVAIKRERLCYLLYWIGFFIMNYFRWSCDCGISEMVMLALAISMLGNQSNQRHVNSIVHYRRYV